MGQHQTYDIRRQQILVGALKAFSEKGYLGASNRDIAQAAGINSTALLYHYFANKEDLFQAVIRENLPPIQIGEQIDILKTQPIPEALTFIGMSIIQAMTKPQTSTLIRLLLSEALRQTEVTLAMYEAGSVHVLAFLYDYFDYLMNNQQIKTADLGVTVRCFLGPFIGYLLTDKLLAVPDENAPEMSLLVEMAVSIFLAGMAYEA